ncbi:hypothetical protein BGW80DRAFT_1302980 [Lactifluus volemus]|nr:hypothetical protein BGW80DRAFT_1302980 [Lactifluus volemus]
MERNVRNISATTHRDTLSIIRLNEYHQLLLRLAIRHDIWRSSQQDHNHADANTRAKKNGAFLQVLTKMTRQ